MNTANCEISRSVQLRYLFKLKQCGNIAQSNPASWHKQFKADVHYWWVTKWMLLHYDQFWPKSALCSQKFNLISNQLLVCRSSLRIFNQTWPEIMLNIQWYYLMNVGNIQLNLTFTVSTINPNMHTNYHLRAIFLYIWIRQQSSRSHWENLKYTK